MPARAPADVTADACWRFATHLELLAHQLGEAVLEPGERGRLAADKGVPVPDIATTFTIKTGKNTGQNRVPNIYLHRLDREWRHEADGVRARFADDLPRLPDRESTTKVVAGLTCPLNAHNATAVIAANALRMPGGWPGLTYFDCRELSALSRPHPVRHLRTIGRCRLTFGRADALATDGAGRPMSDAALEPRQFGAVVETGTHMGTISDSTFVSLDGVVNHMDKWHFDYVDDESNELALEQLRAADAMLMGRKTYEMYAGAWPGRDGKYADSINAISKYVASTTLSEPVWHNTSVLDGDLIEAVRALRAKDGTSILMHGYGPVAKALLQADLLDELHLWVHPHLAGVGDAGDLLIRPGLTKKLELTGTRTLSSGVVALTLRNPDA
ncbi:dihydrofolate reductase family protein [Nonomuraea angiospora]|uniref:dihydrofolate reductase family protein n=1 Tax=Nonomuraea angiospora TaxID=46172 RepID=UPI003791D058